MKVGLHANMVDMQTDKIGSALRDVFTILCERLSGNYGGAIEHLWIDFELIESHAKLDGKPRYPFRFAKRVSGRSNFGLPPSPDNFNVGHFSVRPDFHRLLTISRDEVIPYCLNLIYKELIVLKTKEKKLGGFDSELFRKRFVDECMRLGYKINPN
ncbi:hypothetical protein [Faecalibacter bovis]|uniref:Uncharacterized protein n=1 Tax=Faecalibacter bovis TaxID=2898187 RepID=A0ABX7XB02_9FLAO|nr:hypothetical protein [Faecalibacter bovis]QTV05069.1 hypothetical protein J9309_09735 [Faecalibacter bovis]